MDSTEPRVWWCWCWLAVLITGCAGDGLVTSTGSASYDGKPLDTGIISFHPENPRIAPQGGQIIAGRFRVRTAPGTHRVEIRASRPKAGAVELTPGMTPREQYIPPCYNDESILRADVSSQGPNEFIFELRSQSQP